MAFFRIFCATMIIPSKKPVFRIRIRIGSRLIQVSGSGSGFGIRILTQFLHLICVPLIHYGSSLGSALDPDPYVFGPPGSGSFLICTDPDPDFFLTFYLLFQAVLRIQIRDPVPFKPWIRDPGWVKNPDPDPGSGSSINNQDYISKSLETNFLG